MNLSEETQAQLRSLLMGVLKGLAVLALVGLASYLGVDIRVDQIVDVVSAQDGVVELGVTNFDDLSLGGKLNLDEIDNSQVGAQSLVPKASFYELNPSSTLTLTITTTQAAVGDILILQNVSGSADVVVNDTGATQGGGAITLSTNDLALFVYSNGKWIEIASPDNS